MFDFPKKETRLKEAYSKKTFHDLCHSRYSSCEESISQNGAEENSVVVHPRVGSLPSPRPFPRRKWKNRVAEHVRISPPRGWSSEAARSRVPPTVAPESMTASVGLVVVAANRRESAGRTAAPRREAHRALRLRGCLCSSYPLPGSVPSEPRYGQPAYDAGGLCLRRCDTAAPLVDSFY